MTPIFASNLLDGTSPTDAKRGPGRPRAPRPPRSRQRAVYLGTAGLALAELEPRNFSERLEQVLERSESYFRRFLPVFVPEAWATLAEGLRGSRQRIGGADDYAWELLVEWAQFHGPYAVRAWGAAADPHALSMKLRDGPVDASVAVMEFLDRYRDLARAGFGGAGTVGHAERLRRLGVTGATDVVAWAKAEPKRQPHYAAWRAAIAAARP